MVMMTISKILMRMKKNFKKTKWILTMIMMVKVKMMLRNDCLKFLVTWIVNLYHLTFIIASVFILIMGIDHITFVPYSYT